VPPISLHTANGLVRDTIAPDARLLNRGYASKISAGLLEKIEAYGEARLEAATNLTQEIAILRMLVGERLAQWEANPNNLQCYVLLCDAIEKVQRCVQVAAKVHRDLTANERNDLFMLGTLAQTLVALQSQGHISAAQADLIEQSVAPQGYQFNNGGPVVSTMPTRITTDQIATEMDATVPLVKAVG